MDRPCIRRIICPGPQPGLESDSPVTNYSSEYNDGVSFESYKFPTFDPYDPGLPGWWSSEACSGAFRCVSYISQEDADTCAALLAAQCGFSPPTIPPEPPPGGPTNPCSINPALCFPRTNTYLNSAQSCDFTCPDGTVFTATVAAGTIMSISQALADSVAKELACSRAAEHHICFSELRNYACAGTPYEENFSVSGNDIPYTFNASGLPAGFTFETTGFSTFKILGTADIADNYDVVVTATSGSYSQSKTYSIPVLGIMNDPILPQAFGGTPYNAVLTGGGGLAPYTFAIVDGELPTGLTLDSATGVISGTSTQLVGRDINFRITDAAGRICQKAMFIEVICAIGPDTLPNPVRSQWYSQTLTNGGLLGTTWTIVDGALPTGLSLNALTGEISGSPDDQASYQFTVRNSDGVNGCNKEYTVTVQPAVGPDWAELLWGVPTIFEQFGGDGDFTPVSSQGASFNGLAVTAAPLNSTANVLSTGTFSYDGPAANCTISVDLSASGTSANVNNIVRVRIKAPASFNFEGIWPLSGGGFSQTFPFNVGDSGGIPYNVIVEVVMQAVTDGSGQCSFTIAAKPYTLGVI